MTNEEMLAAMQQMIDQRFSNMQQSIETKFAEEHKATSEGFTSMEQRLDKLETKVDIIQENVAITRNATNTLLDWAEKAQIEVKIPLYKKVKSTT